MEPTVKRGIVNIGMSKSFTDSVNPQVRKRKRDMPQIYLLGLLYSSLTKRVNFKGNVLIGDKKVGDL